MLVSVICASMWVAVVEWRTPILAKEAYYNDMLTSMNESIAKLEEQKAKLKKDVEYENEQIKENIVGLFRGFEFDF